METLKEKQILPEKPFDPSEWLSSHGVKSDTSTINLSSKRNFKELCSVVKADLDKKVEGFNGKEQEDWLQKQHKAIIGDLSSVQYFVNQIEQTLRDRNVSSTDYPDYYNSLSEAIFHEVWGRGILQKWYHYPESEAACIIGTELWLDIDGQFIRQQERFESIDKVKEIRRAFTMRDENAVLNSQNPELEIEHEDGSRITIIIKPRGKQEYIMFRRFTVKNFSLEQQAEFQTIAKEDVPIFRALSRTMPNIVVAGRVRSAKSTFLKTLIQERKTELVIASLEKHFELSLKKHMPERMIFEIQVSEGDLHKATPRLLRMEHDFLVIGECRSLEWEAALLACERGERGMLTTYHITDRHAIVNQISRHLLDEFPQRRPNMEIERVARNIDLIIHMSTDRDRRKKRVVGVTEVGWDDELKKTITQDLILWDKRTQKYYYSSNISERLFHLMEEEDQYEALRLISLLKDREKNSPLSAIEKG
ncbi:Flp pilus assembly complex ATPase component TadA [Fictibacillus sp. KIGAM418]|uniref:Flp pilus assembly complex ATPase component TadA n=1 Tax=Fictibacillus marinisediminis TaxID=2878389 RepID=A0A9X1XF82_9BACL|nr:ATPase, T2SS/T4P/T4SS family [Fictibacillus marinisediminis]MCK6259596.1 Flp pilus assembly complex ATPase component TadA [Fictibacillus marinisediminis]